jgi:NADP-dependent aldehyde dehydrogenase
MKIKLSGGHFIDGSWRAEETAGAESFTAINPATGEPLAPNFAEATADDVDAALRAARAAFDATRGLDPRWPAGLLEAIARQIEALGDELLERGEAETALPGARLTGERARTCAQLRMFAEIVREGSWVEAVIDTADAQRQPLPKPDLRRMFRPRGPVAVFGASNFPFAFGACGGDTASALAAGNPVIVKGHPSHPGTSELFARAVGAAIDECNVPRGLFGLLQGRSHELSGRLVAHANTAAVGFTGSRRAGRALFDIAARRETPIPVYAEMGSVNPTVVLPAAIRERGATIAQDLSASLLLGGGQFCTKPGVVFVVGDDDRTFLEKLAGHVRSAAPVTMLNRGLRDAFCDGAVKMSATAGVKTLVTGAPAANARMSPTLFETTAAEFLRQPELREEAFGPGGLVVSCNGMDEAVACLEAAGGNLTGTVHLGEAEDRAAVRRLMQVIEANVGRVIVNGYPTGVEVGRAIVHGGPYPATTEAGSTSVGSAAIRRFVRLVAYQNAPQHLLPAALQDANPLGIKRLVNGEWTDRRLGNPTS